jgi:hypothetical protein
MPVDVRFSPAAITARFGSALLAVDRPMGPGNKCRDDSGGVAGAGKTTE